ncbi:MAG: hypothetical protein LBJ73_01095 [Rickettsiales bacterium]|nr:hypothetical protein [Rickettsiales bacterium]
MTKKKDFDTAIKQIKENTKSKIIISKKLEKAWDVSPLVPTAQQMKSFLEEIMSVKNKLQQNIGSIDLSKKSKNAVWGLNGGELVKDKVPGIEEDMKNLDKLVNSLNIKSNSNEIRFVLEKMTSLEQRVRELLIVQNQSRFHNFFHANFPIFVR